jgi:hypothetical protein
VDPAEQVPGGQFVVSVVQDADVETSGAEVNVSFDRTLVHVVDITRGSGYADATLLMGTAGQTKQDVIDQANGVSGMIQNVAGYYAPGAGSVPAGEAVFLMITMAPVAGANGVSAIVLSAPEVGDTNGDAIDGVATLNGRIAVGDADGDGISGIGDNCPFDANSGQENSDGNLIDLTPPEAQDDTSWVNSDSQGDACDPDADNDALANDVEANLGPGGTQHSTCLAATANTSPTAMDSDGDLFTDGAECALGTDPMNASSKPTDSSCATFLGVTTSTDTDADGVRDVIEYCHYGSDRTKTDTDGDGAADGCEIASVDNVSTVNDTDKNLVWAHLGATLGFGSYVLDFDVDRNGAIAAQDAQWVYSREASCP